MPEERRPFLASSPCSWLRAAVACLSVACTADDDVSTSTGTPGGTSASTVEDGSSEGGSSSDPPAMEVDCSDASRDSIPVCLPRRDDGSCSDSPDEVELCRKTCIESCCFEVASIACGPDVAQTDRCCYWIIAGEMHCADSLEESCLPQ